MKVQKILKIYNQISIYKIHRFCRVKKNFQNNNQNRNTNKQFKWEKSD
jgi:hypothetical protein